MCGHGQHHRGHGYSCCCGNGGFEDFGPGRGFGRRFASREERLAQMEAYLKDLQAEAKAVEERLAEMKASGWQPRPAQGDVGA